MSCRSGWPPSSAKAPVERAGKEAARCRSRVRPGRRDRGRSPDFLRAHGTCGAPTSSERSSRLGTSCPCPCSRYRDPDGRPRLPRLRLSRVDGRDADDRARTRLNRARTGYRRNSQSVSTGPVIRDNELPGRLRQMARLSLRFRSCTSGMHLRYPTRHPAVPEDTLPTCSDRTCPAVWCTRSP